MVANGYLSLASFVRFNLYLAMLVMPLRTLGMWIGQAQRATASGERIFQVIDEPEDIADASGCAASCHLATAALSSSDVTFGYDPGRPVLEDVDLELDRGSRRRPDRPHRLGQDDARIARAALLRRAARTRHRSTAPTSATCSSLRCDARSG